MTRKNIVIAAIILVIAVGFSYAAFSKNNNQRSYQNASDSSASLLEHGDMENWPVYKNEALGISFVHPINVNGSDMVFFQVGNILFVTVASSNIYIHRDEITGKSDGDILRSEAQLENKYATPWDETPWRIWVQTARDDKDLESIIQVWFGDWHEFADGCKLGAKRFGSIAGVYNVGVESVREDPQGENGPDGSCWINWRIGFKYSPSHKRAAVWDLGQEDRFSGYDTDIANSFSFM